MGSLGAHTTDHFGDLPSGGITFEVDNAVVVPPRKDTYLQDLLTDWIDKARHRYPPSLESTPCSTAMAPVISSPGPTRCLRQERPRGAEGSDNEGGPGTSDGHLPRLRKREGEDGGEWSGGDSPQKSETAGRGAKKLATPNVQEVSYQSMPGPSIQQVLVWPTAPEKLTWVEGSVEGVWHHDSSVVGQEAAGNKEQAEELFKIPPRLKERHRALLAATQVDWERAAVDVLKCRLCPDADFSHFEDFKRHCDTQRRIPQRYSSESSSDVGCAQTIPDNAGECINATADKAD
ncbi:hypothetical protein BGW80DRAFT_1459353 [Lactifluus volemus]|nr:hypothetical protein BGW80DRAFT_1459353 [Lactifluus volemus]